MKNVLIIAVLFCTISCNSRKHIVEVVGTNFMESDMILFNTANYDRNQIAELLIEIEKCNPAVIGVDLIFNDLTTPSHDTSLARALNKLSNKVVAYKFDDRGEIVKSNEVFSKHAPVQGYVNFIEKNDLLTHLIPTSVINDIQYESFVLKVVQTVKPGIKMAVKPQVEVPITFKRTEDKYYIFGKEDLKDNGIRESVKGKIVLIGYLGPGIKDKYYTPLKFIAESGNKNEPDSYGLIIIANAIRTVLDMYAE